jgi:hypothetical protein
MANATDASLRVVMEMPEIDWQDVYWACLANGSYHLPVRIKIFSPSGELMDVKYPVIALTLNDIEEALR